MTDAAAVRVAALAALLGEKTRASMCLHLLDGRAWTAGELAKATGVGAATASEHLDRLVSGGLLAEERQGRHRYVRLAGPEAAALVEQLAAASGPVPAPTGYSGVRAGERLANARTCYDHLAGRLGSACSTEWSAPATWTAAAGSRSRAAASGGWKGSTSTSSR